jgi:hypothetical protein
MERLSKTTEKSAEHGPSNVFSLAMVVGLMSFFVAGDLPGGLTSVQGFLVGFCAVMFLYAALVVLESRGSRLPEPYKTHLNTPAVSIEKTENENGVTIQIYVSMRPALSPGIAAGSPDNNNNG